MASCILAFSWLVTFSQPVPVQAAPATSVAIWYRGEPAGVPREDDLAAMRAQGFTGVVWPSTQTGRADDLKKMAARLGLSVSFQAAPVPLTPETAKAPKGRVDIDVSRLLPDQIPALVWRAVAHGARAFAFDPGAFPGSGLTSASGRLLPWVPAAATLARQLTFNARVFAEVRPGPALNIQPPAPPGVDVVLLETARAWVLISTNTSPGRLKTVVDLPPSVAPALWTSLLDGSNMSMLSRPIGPRWTFELNAGEAGVWTIEK